VALSGTGRDDSSLGVRLLTDIKGIFTTRGVERIRSVDLVHDLNDIEESHRGRISRSARLILSHLAKLLEIRDSPQDRQTRRGYDCQGMTTGPGLLMLGNVTSPAPARGLCAVTPVTLEARTDAQASSRNMNVEPRA